MLNPSLKNISLSKDAYKQYARHLIVKEIGLAGQKRLKKASILFIGAGGLASSAIIYLAASGIGSIGIIDGDIISKSNLHRQILYNSNDIDNLKVEAARMKIHQINSSCSIVTYPYQLNPNNAIELIKNYDIVIDACDNFETRYIIDSSCYILHKVHIYGAIQNFEGQISVFNYKGGPRYSHLYPSYLKLTNNNCNNIGVLGLLPGIIGLMQATEAIKIIIGINSILSGCILIYNAIDLSFKKIKISTSIINKNEYRTNRLQDNEINLLSHEQLNNILTKKDIVIIDVRQKLEFITAHIKNAINIPLNNLKNKSTLDYLLQNCLKKTIIIYCSSNSRAIHASQILRNNNIKHYRLKNGLNQKLFYIQSHAMS